MNSENCTSDFDCSGNLKCYPSSVPWSTGANSFCDCPHLYGYSRTNISQTNCVNFEIIAVYDVISNVILIGLGMVVVLYYCWKLKHKSTRRALRTFTKRWTLFSSLFSLLFLVTHRGLLLAGVLQPELSNQSGPSDATVKFAPYLSETGIALIGFTMLFTFAVLNVSLVWMELLTSVEAFVERDLIPEWLKTHCTCLSYSRAVYSVEIFLFIAGSYLLLVEGDEILAGILSLSPLLLALFMYTRGRYVLLRTINSTMNGLSEGGEMRRFAVAVSETSGRVILGVAFYMVNLVIQVVMVPSLVVGPGDLPFPYYLDDVADVVRIGVLAAIAHYLVVSTGSREQMKSTATAATLGAKISSLSKGSRVGSMSNDFAKSSGTSGFTL